MDLFEQNYRCFSVAAAGKPDHLEHGDKILLPASALAKLSEMTWLDYPMTFQLWNPKSNKRTHCGIIEFSADEGTAVIPRWVMDNIALSNGGVAELSYSNPKAVLEKILRAFSRLTIRDTIPVSYLDRKFHHDDMDCEVDYDAPLGDHKMPEIKVPAAEKLTASFTAFMGAARRLDGASTSSGGADVDRNAVVPGGKRKAVQEEETKLAFKPFSGKSYRLMSD